jgi:hypothetical protein
MDPARAPIFIVGTGRSGTTLLRLMLCAHPRIYITHEAAFYWVERLTARKKLAPRKALEAYFETKPFRWLGIEPSQVLDGLPDPLPRERLGEAYAAVMRETAARYGRPRFGDKTPDPQCLPQIFRDFPDAKVLRIVRDPRSTAESMTRVPFASASVLANAAIIEDEHRRMKPFLDRILTTRLEDLLTDTRSAMARILDFIGEPWDDAVLDHARHVPDVRDMPPQPWLDSAAGDRARPEAKWKSLTPRQIRLVERVAKGAMAEGR